VSSRRGFFLVLEGPDKSGKSTQAGLLAQALRGRGLAVAHTREPGGTSVAEGVRRILLDPALRVDARTELFLYEAARAQHVTETVRPALARGEVVVCERFTMSTDVYQGLARGLGLKTTAALNAVATGGLKPDLTIVLDVPARAFESRDPGRPLDRLEREDPAFHERVRGGYRRLARGRPKTALLDASAPADDVHRAVLAKVDKALK